MAVTNFYAGSLRYGPNGKKRKTKSMSKPKIKTMADFDWSTPKQNSAVRQTTHYPSAPLTPVNSKVEDQSWKLEERGAARRWSRRLLGATWPGIWSQ